MSAENEPIVALESTADSEATENPNGDIDGAVEQQADVNHDEQNGHGVAADARAQGTSGTATVVVDEPPEKNADSAPPAVKRRKVLQHEAAYLRNLPGAKCYEKSFMHREMITHVLATCTDFIITVSCDGHLKFWKKQHGEGVEFVKHFRAHVGQIVHVHQNWNGTLLCTAGVDKTVKVFDIANFDMITMIRLDYEPLACAWVHHPSDAISALAVSESSSGKVHVYDGRGAGAVALHTFDKLHSKPVMLMQFNAVLDCAISIDQLGMIEYWTGPKYDYEFPKTVQFEYKTDTDLYTFAKEKVSPVCVAISPTGKHFGTWASDKKIRIFNFVTGKMTKVIDESINSYENDKSNYQDLPHTEIGRRLAVEKDLDQSKFARYATLCFDESGHFLIYPSIIGIKVVNLTTNQCVRVIGKGETLRFVSVALCRAVPGPAERLHGVAPTMEAEASDNPALKHSQPDPMLVCSAYKRARFYLFTNTEPFGAAGDDQGAAAAQDRDVFNEKPLKTDIITSFESAASDRKLTDTCVLHTSYGDIHCKLFMRQTPKTVENFVTHARRGYYNGVVFHRIINKFMIQTGDPTGTGTGGESIWGGEFGDEIVPELKHDLPYTISMANAGPNTNGSQFFITVIPCPWLDGKHTVFGRVFRGMEVVQTISKVPANSKTGKPREDISVVSITLK